jgi:hypothetical protein
MHNLFISPRPGRKRQHCYRKVRVMQQHFFDFFGALSESATGMQVLAATPSSSGLVAMIAATADPQAIVATHGVWAKRRAAALLRRGCSRKSRITNFV